MRGMSVLKAAADSLKDPAPSPLESGQKYEPNGDQIATFERVYNAVMRPTQTLFGGLTDGTLTPDEIVSIATVYPHYIQEVKDTVMANLADHPKRELSFPQKMGIQMLFASQGTVVDPELAPAHVAWLSNVYQQHNAAPPQMPQSKPTQAGMEHLNLASAEATPLQQAANRRGA